MQKKATSITNRIMSGLLALILTFGLIPMEAFAAGDGGDIGSQVSNGGSAKVGLSFDTKQDTPIKDSKGTMTFWMGQSNDGSNPIRAYCMDHSKGVKSKNMNLIVKKDPRIDNNETLYNVYFLGSNVGRDSESHRTSMSILAKERTGIDWGDWGELTADEYNAATQLACWMCLTMADGRRMLSIEGQRDGYGNNVYDTNAYDVIKEGNNTERAKKVLNAAKGLYAMCDKMAIDGAKLSERNAGLT